MPRARAGSGGDPRERWTEGIFGLAFVAAAVSMAVWLPAEPVSVASAVWLVGLFFVLCQVGVRRRRGAHPARAARGGADAASPDPFGRSAARGRRRSSWPACRPSPRDARRRWSYRRSRTAGSALHRLSCSRSSGYQRDRWATAGVVALATAGQVALDCRHGDLAAALRSRPPCAAISATASSWVYLVDVLFTPVAVIAAVAGHLALVYCRCGPAARRYCSRVFARERRGRIENALELHRTSPRARQRLQSIVQNSSDLITIVGARWRRSGRSPGSAETVFGAEWRAAVGMSILHERVHPDDAGRLEALLARVAQTEPGSAQHEAEWRIRHADGSYGYVETVATNLLDDERVARHRADRARHRRAPRLRGAAAPPRLPRPADPAGQPRAVLRPDRARARAHAARRAARRCAVRRPRRLQGRSTTTSATPRRRAAGRRRAAPARLRCAPADTVARLGGDEFGVLLEASPARTRSVQTARADPRGASASRSLLHGEPVLHQARASASRSSPTRTASVEELLRRPTSRCTRPSAAASGRYELYDATSSSSAVPASTRREPERATWFLRGDEQREEIVRCCSATTRSDACSSRSSTCGPARSPATRRSRASTPEPRPPNAWFAQAHRFGLGYALEARARRGRARRAPDRPDGHLPHAQPEPVRAAVGDGPGRAARALEDSSSRSPRTSCCGRRPASKRARRPARARRRIAIDDAGRRLRRPQARDAAAAGHHQARPALVDGRRARRRPGRR